MGEESRRPSEGRRYSLRDRNGQSTHPGRFSFLPIVTRDRNNREYELLFDRASSTDFGSCTIPRTRRHKGVIR